MAESGSPKAASLDAASAPPPLPSQQQDWEMLSLSMSSSGFVKSDPAEGSKTAKPEEDAVEKNPSDSAQNSNDSSDQAPSATATASAVTTSWSDPFSSSDGLDKVPEPFTEGWNPRMSASITDFHGFASDTAPAAEGDFPDAQSFADDSDSSFMAVSAISSAAVAEKGVCEEDVSRRRPHTVAQIFKVSKKQSSWRKQPRVSTAMVSFAVTAAVLGFAILGHRWHAERYQNHQLRLELSAKDEKVNDLIYQVSRMKEVINGHQKVHVFGSSGF